MINEIVDDHHYEYVGRSFESKTFVENSSNVLDRIEKLLDALIDPNCVEEVKNSRTNGLSLLLAAADSCSNEQLKS